MWRHGVALAVGASLHPVACGNLTRRAACFFILVPFDFCCLNRFFDNPTRRTRLYGSTSSADDRHRCKSLSTVAVPSEGYAQGVSCGAGGESLSAEWRPYSHDSGLGWSRQAQHALGGACRHLDPRHTVEHPICLDNLQGFDHTLASVIISAAVPALDARRTNQGFGAE